MNIISGFITVSDFQNSAYYCAFPSECCTGTIESDIINELIFMASDMIANYCGRDFNIRQYEDNFLGKGINSHHLRMMPLSGIVEIGYRSKRELRGERGYGTLYANGVASLPLTGLITDYYIVNPDTSFIEIPNGFYKNYRYRVSYMAGYEFDEIPTAVKTATKIMVSQLASMIDTGNLVNVNLNYETMKLDKTSMTFGNSRFITNLVLKDVKDFGFLPIMVQNLLSRYKYSKNMS